MKHLSIFLGIFLALAASRFIPHPPNYTNLIALSFYVPAFFGIKFIPLVVLSFFITDLYFGFHSSLFFTWGSVILIGYIPLFFKDSISSRLLGASSGAILFYIVTNFGVWASGSYGYTLEGLVNCYILAIPFFWPMLVSTIAYSLIIELSYKIYTKGFKKVGVS
tara:strand:+ start:101 stop:592 length:492 start_codon:yes stop_codon:yes gene_type:complete